jgi:hypothetical protein
MHGIEITDEMRAAPPDGWRVEPAHDRDGFYSFSPDDRWPMSHENTREETNAAAWVESIAEIPPGFKLVESAFDRADGTRASSWHGQGADGVPIRSCVSSDRDTCIEMCWRAWGMTRDEHEQRGEALVENGRAVIKLRQALPNRSSTSLLDLLDELLAERQVERLLGRQVTPKQVLR